jgi:hypothetical protein
MSTQTAIKENVNELMVALTNGCEDQAINKTVNKAWPVGRHRRKLLSREIQKGYAYRHILKCFFLLFLPLRSP